jgi:hypothetical protein
VRGKREVRYVVSRLTDPDDTKSERENLGWHPYLALAKTQADRTGPGTFVDAEGGTFYFDGPFGRGTHWEVEWTNPNLYEGRNKNRRLPPGSAPPPLPLLDLPVGPVEPGENRFEIGLDHRGAAPEP